MTRNKRGALVAIASIVMIVAAAGAAFGFTDDSSAGGTTFVTAAGALKAAGCAAGFGDGSFGYNGTVTRGQDAIFQMACAPGEAYVNGSGSAAVSLATTGVAQAISSVTFTAGINTGGLQFVEVRGALAAACTCQASITVTPSAGSTAASPPSQSSPTTAFTGITTFEGGFTVPTGQSFTATLNVSGPAATSVQPVSLAINSAPRGNTVSSGRLS